MLSLLVVLLSPRHLKQPLLYGLPRETQKA
jgi:hypothetical protein